MNFSTLCLLLVFRISSYNFAIPRRMALKIKSKYTLIIVDMKIRYIVCLIVNIWEFERSWFKIYVFINYEFFVVKRQSEWMFFSSSIVRTCIYNIITFATFSKRASLKRRRVPRRSLGCRRFDKQFSLNEIRMKLWIIKILRWMPFTCICLLACLHFIVFYE